MKNNLSYCKFFFIISIFILLVSLKEVQAKGGEVVPVNKTYITKAKHNQWHKKGQNHSHQPWKVNQSKSSWWPSIRRSYHTTPTWKFHTRVKQTDLNQSKNTCAAPRKIWDNIKKKASQGSNREVTKLVNEYKRKFIHGRNQARTYHCSSDEYNYILEKGLKTQLEIAAKNAVKPDRNSNIQVQATKINVSSNPNIERSGRNDKKTHNKETTVATTEKSTEEIVDALNKWKEGEIKSPVDTTKADIILDNINKSYLIKRVLANRNICEKNGLNTPQFSCKKSDSYKIILENKQNSLLGIEIVFSNDELKEKSVNVELLMKKDSTQFLYYSVQNLEYYDSFPYFYKNKKIKNNSVIKFPYNGKHSVILRLGNATNNCKVKLSLNDKLELKQSLDKCWIGFSKWYKAWDGEFQNSNNLIECNHSGKYNNNIKIVTCLIPNEVTSLTDSFVSKEIDGFTISKGENSNIFDSKLQYKGKKLDRIITTFLSALKQRFGYELNYAYFSKGDYNYRRHNFNLTEEYLSSDVDIATKPIPIGIVINMTPPRGMPEKCLKGISKTIKWNFFTKNNSLDIDKYKPSCKLVTIRYPEWFDNDLIDTLIIKSVSSSSSNSSVVSSCKHISDKSECFIQNSDDGLLIQLPYDLIHQVSPFNLNDNNKISLDLSKYKIVIPRSFFALLNKSQFYSNTTVTISYCKSANDNSCVELKNNIETSKLEGETLNIYDNLTSIPEKLVMNFFDNDCYEIINNGKIFNLPLKNRQDDYSSFFKGKIKPKLLEVKYDKTKNIQGVILFYPDKKSCNKLEGSGYQLFEKYNIRFGKKAYFRKCLKKNYFYSTVISRGKDSPETKCVKSKLRVDHWFLDFKKPLLKLPIHFLIINNEELKIKSGGKKKLNTFIQSLVDEVYVYRLDTGSGVEKVKLLSTKGMVSSTFDYPQVNINSFRVMKHYLAQVDQRTILSLKKVFVFTSIVPEDFPENILAASLGYYFSKEKLHYFSFNCQKLPENQCTTILSLADLNFRLKGIIRGLKDL